MSDLTNTTKNTTNPYHVLNAIAYLAAFVAILWYIRWWWRTTKQLRNTLSINGQTYLQKTKAVQHIGDQPISSSREGFLDLANEAGRIGAPPAGPYLDRTIDLKPEYSKHCYSTPIDKPQYYNISKLANQNADDTSIDDQSAGLSNGLDVSINQLPKLATPPTNKNSPFPEDSDNYTPFEKNRRFRNRQQQLKSIADEIQDKTRLSEDEYRAKYAWHDSASRCLTIPPGFGKLTPRKTADGSRYEYAYTGDIRDAQTRTSMDILSDYPRKEWACNRVYQQCTVPTHLIGNAPEYYRQVQKRKLEQKNTGEQWQKSITAQLPPQTLPPVYPG